MNKLFFGCVEDRKSDPLKIGRMKVRIVGLHTNNKTKLPTEDLPWATPITPITSASVSGIGQSPTGIVEGSWVVLTFIDSDKDLQYPVVIGTIPGVPGINQSLSSAEFYDVPEDSNPDIPPSVVKTEDGSIVTDSSGNPVTTTVTSETPFIGSLTKANFDSLKNAVKQKESSNSYTKMGGSGGAYIGAYQFGVAGLEDLGYIKPGTYRSRGGSSAVSADSSVWTGKNGVLNREVFLSSVSSQDDAFEAYARLNAKRLSGVDIDRCIPEKLAGLLSVAHNQGSGAANKLLKGTDGADGFGTTASNYYSTVGYKSVAGKTTNELPNYVNIYRDALDKSIPVSKDTNPYDVSASPVVKELSREASVGFKDPSGLYPLADLLGEPDTHRLARSQKINRTIVGDRESSRIKKIPVANSTSTWEEPESSYNTEYPYNKVFGTESGHVMEFDDTPGSERINLQHTTGTYFEIDPNGNRIERIRGTHILVVDEDDLVYIQGSGHVCIDGDLSVNVKGAASIYVGGDANIKVAGNMNSYVGGDKTEYIGGNLKTVIGGSKVEIAGGDISSLAKGNRIDEAKGKTSIKSGDTVAINGSKTYLQSSTVSADSSNSDTSLKSMDFVANIKQPKPIARSENNSMRKEDTPEAKFAPQSPPPKEEEMTDQTPKPVNNAVPATCTNIEKPYTTSTILSTNYTLGKLCVDGGLPPINGQNSLTQDQIVCNIMQLATNVIEPLRAKFGGDGFVINSCFRPGTGKSQHQRGMAVDIGFKPKTGKLSKKEYYDRAVIIRDMIQYDQLLLEYRDPGQYWIHISFNPSGNRRQVLTLLNDKVYKTGLVLLT